MKKLNLLLILFVLPFLLVAQNGDKKLTIADFTQNNTFDEKEIEELRSMNDGLHYSALENSGSKIVKYSYKTGKSVAVLLDLSKVKDAPIASFSNYSFNANETKILLATAKKKIYRYSFSADYYVWNSVNNEIVPLSENGGQRMATFSPDGQRVAFVRENNIFIKNLRFGTEHQVTFDGECNKIINGAPDWVYEEEFGFTKAFAWSPDGKKLAYYKFDESEVPVFNMTLFNGGYPSNFTLKYPRAGEKNSAVNIFVYDLQYKKSTKMDTGEESDHYIPRIQWTKDPNKLCIMRLNRHQNHLEFLFANPGTGYSKVTFSERNDRYIDEAHLNNLRFLDDGKHFIFTSEKEGWSHAYLYDMNGYEVRRVTNGDFDVTDFYGYDQKNRLFYYQAAAESPLQREVYYVSLDGKKSGKLSTQEGTNEAKFSTTFQYYINEFSNATTPKQTTLHDRKGKLIRVLEDNQLLKEQLQQYRFNSRAFFSFKTSNDDALNGWMIKPVNFDPNKRYPVLINQYSGPNSQNVLDEWGLSWYNYMAQEGYLVVCVDPRGTGGRGEEFRKCTYLQLGKYESDDMIETARWLASQPYVDADNIAIWGWSYGGFIVALSMCKSDLFKAGLCIAPVTHYRYYNSVYTERFMRTPQENPGGYDDNAPLTLAANLKGKLLLVHGSGDENVHVQNSMELSEQLEQAGIQFDMAIYTNRRHSIRKGKNTRAHLYTRFTDFLNRHLK